MTPPEIEKRDDIGPAVELWQAGDGDWWWAYSHPQEEVMLLSNRPFASRREARQSARRAYPGVPIIQAASEDDLAEDSPFGGKALLAGVAAGLVLAVVVWLAARRHQPAEG